MNRKINELLDFYGSLGRPLTLLEIGRLSQEETANIHYFLDKAVANSVVLKDSGFFTLKKFKNSSGLKRREQDFLLDRKWRKLLRLRSWFNFVPFLDFVMASGSMAIGNVTDHSDFDVLVGVKHGRIFTARYAILLIFTILGVRRPDDKEASSPDKLCFNHFVTNETYGKPPYNIYRSELYKNMVPIYGDKGALYKFIGANEWASASNDALMDLRYLAQRFNLGRWFLELLLAGRLGDYLEDKVLAPVAKKRLRQYVGRHHEQGRVVVSDQELEFHFNLPYERSVVSF